MAIMAIMANTPISQHFLDTTQQLRYWGTWEHQARGGGGPDKSTTVGRTQISHISLHGRRLRHGTGQTRTNRQSPLE